MVLDGKFLPLRMGPGMSTRWTQPCVRGWTCLGPGQRRGCCTCRAQGGAGAAEMDKNFTLEPWEMAWGFVLTPPARATVPQLCVSFDER